VVLLLNDCEKGEGVDLAKKYEVRVYPTYAMVDHAGEVTARWAGYAGVDGFIAQVDAALADRSTIAAKKERFQSEPDLALALALAQHAEAVFASTEAVDYYRKAMALDPALTAEMRGKIFMSMFYGLRSEDFTVDQLLAEGQAILADPEVTVDQVMQVAGVVKRVAPTEEFVPVLRRALAATAAGSDDPEEAADLAYYRRQLVIDEALLIDEDRPRALQLRREAMEDGWQEDPGELNRFAWWCLQNDLNLEEAYELALKGAELAGSDADRANILDTAAQIAFARGEVDQAVAHQREAVALLPERQALQRNLERFEAAAAAVGTVIEPRTGMEYPDRVVIAHGGERAEVTVTGVAVRLRTILKVEVYTIASYLSDEVPSARLAGETGAVAAAIRTLDVPKRIQMDLRRSFGRDKLVSSFSDVIKRNYEDTSAFAGDFEVLLGYFDRDAEDGDQIIFDYLPGVGLVTTLNGEIKGTIANRALMEALWTVWFGRKPADGGMQKDLVAAL
jgi:tetratricopeptide (TPR) repeat protein